MDTKQFSQGDYINAQAVKNSTTRKAVILSVSAEEVTFNGETKIKLLLDVMMDGMNKKYMPNKDSIRNIQLELGDESDDWLNHTLKFKLITMVGKECVLATVEE